MAAWDLQCGPGAPVASPSTLVSLRVDLQAEPIILKEEV
mgnify:FL=1